MSLELILTIAALLLILSIIAGKASLQFGLPAPLLFLIIGMLAGSNGPIGIYFDDAWLAQSVGVLALVLILFSGGLGTDWQMIRPVLWTGLILANLGVLISALLVAIAAHLLLQFSILEGFLLGAIISSTDAAAVFAVMRTRDVNLRDNLEGLIELESGSNDPIAVFLTIGLTMVLADPSRSLASLAPLFVLQMTVGGVAGYAMGRLMAITINRAKLQLEGLYPALALGLVLFTYGSTALINGSGFLAVYLAGIVLGNCNFAHKRSLIRFYDGLAWLMQIAMFLVLGLLVYPSRIVPIIGEGLLMSAFLVFVARPIAVFVSLAFSRYDWRAKVMVSWAGLRGAAPIVLATFPLLAGLDRAGMVFNLVFFIVLTSVLIQGTTIAHVARWLGVQQPRPQATFHYPQEFIPQISASSQLVELTVVPGSPACGRAIMELGLPRGALVVLINRSDDSLVPDGTTILEPGDRVLLLAERSALDDVRRVLSNVEI
ncbi:MAG: potassium/proton antiporter [Roseiflexus sp.]|jgi:cell volume regulation protein A|nr:potassium/proton antiporter [Roseiflexus sp.]MBO9333311.1 potassium/proton antiporter [Roseiflexus sp.]MBO9342001.1 potassium/proton antiporter [Roseiflexus sp.]MBO9365566.1 potassium/proton antiporter [Roseiflexus sp.]MBO9381634.1 potassium/proton antiporter [Roseiflexus sp.]